jgi:general secretion pathway protein B
MLHSSDDVVQIPQPSAHDRPAPVASPPPNEPASPKGQAVSPLTDGAIRLTPELRASLPPLAVGGAMYSDTPASRMMVINGQLFHEGDTVASEVTLEAVQLKSAIIRYRGQRYVLDY